MEEKIKELENRIEALESKYSLPQTWCCARNGADNE
jgi:hypothetical protein